MSNRNDEIAARNAARTQGEHRFYDGYGCAGNMTLLCYDGGLPAPLRWRNDADRDFHDHAPADITFLLAENRRLEDLLLWVAKHLGLALKDIKALEEHKVAHDALNQKETDMNNDKQQYRGPDTNGCGHPAEKQGTPLVCPVCGREMKLTPEDTNGNRWVCYHGADSGTWTYGAFHGPREDRDGSKVRAQIAAMQQAWHNGHPHTHFADGEPKPHLGMEPTGDGIKRFCGKHSLDFVLARLDVLELQVAELKATAPFRFGQRERTVK